MRSAGFIEIEEIDETAEFIKTARGWRAARYRHASELRTLEGKKEFDEGQANRKARLEAIEAGLLRRHSSWAVRVDGQGLERPESRHRYIRIVRHEVKSDPLLKPTLDTRVSG